MAGKRVCCWRRRVRHRHISTGAPRPPQRRPRRASLVAGGLGHVEGGIRRRVEHVWHWCSTMGGMLGLARAGKWWEADAFRDGGAAAEASPGRSVGAGRGA
eukprot:4323723-Prymnesium_polylepis.1